MNNELSQEQQFILDAVAKSICGMDREGTVTFCNDALLELTGYATEEIVGKNAHDVLHRCRPDGTEFPREECDLHKLILLGEPAHISIGVLWKKNGTCIPVEYRGRQLRAPVKRTHYVVAIKDVSEIEIAKEALRRSEEQFRRILASMPDVPWTSDVHGRTRYVSPKIPKIETLMSIWGLPVPLVHAVAYHHHPNEAGENTFSSLTAVHVADAIVSESDSSPLNHDATPDASYLSCLGLSEKESTWRELYKEPIAKDAAASS